VSTTPVGAARVRTFVILLVGLALVLPMGYWIGITEIAGEISQITHSVPAIPGLVALILLVALGPLVRRLHLRELSRGEIAVVYIFITVAATMYGSMFTRYILGFISSIYYFSTPASPTEQLATGIPGWVTPNNPIAHKWLYEGSPHGHVPWQMWWTPVACWSLFIVLFGGTLLCLMLLFMDRWIEHERLSFPLVQLPLEIVGGGRIGSFFGNRMVWWGIAVATVFNGYLITRAIFFGGPATGYPFAILTGALTDYPWAALHPIVAYLNPAIISLGYLVSAETAFSIWSLYVMRKLSAVVLAAFGFRKLSFSTGGAEKGFEHPLEQGIGAYLALGLAFLWQNRVAVQQAGKDLVQWLTGKGKQAASSARMWVVVGIVVGSAACVQFLNMAGMEPWLAALYLVILLLVGVAYGKIRAETGIPTLKAFPYGMPDTVITNFVGQRHIIGSDPSLLSPTIFAMTRFLSWGQIVTLSAYQIEGLALGRKTGVNWRLISGALMLAVAWGMLWGFATHLNIYHEQGGVAKAWFMEPARQAHWGYNEVLNNSQMPTPPDTVRAGFTLLGALTTGLIAMARSRWISFPFHPLGFAVMMAYGGTIWFPFFIVWLIKTLIMRYGGARAYRNLVPFFLGLVVGHYITTGLIWGILSTILGGPLLRYTISYAG